MALIPVLCPGCGHDNIIKRGKTENGKQRYFCQHPECSVNTFILDYDYNGYLPEVKKKDRRHGDEWQWDSGYRASVSNQSDHRHQ